jgi:hypothetical protein
MLGLLIAAGGADVALPPSFRRDPLAPPLDADDPKCDRCGTKSRRKYCPTCKRRLWRKP